MNKLSDYHELPIRLQEATDSYQLLLQFFAQDHEELDFEEQVQLILYKWPDVASSAIQYIVQWKNEDWTNTGKTYSQLVADLDAIIVGPLESFFDGVSEKLEHLGVLPKSALNLKKEAKALDAIEGKKKYIKAINYLLDILEAVTKTKHPRIGNPDD